MQIKIPSYKYTNSNSVIQVYKFKPIFKNIEQTKALYFSYVFLRMFTLLLSYMNGESEKQTHLCRTLELSDYREVGLSDCWTNGLSDYSYSPKYLCLRYLAQQRKEIFNVLVNM